VQAIERKLDTAVLEDKRGISFVASRFSLGQWWRVQRRELSHRAAGRLGQEAPQIPADLHV